MNILLFPLVFFLAEGIYSFRGYRLAVGTILTLYALSFLSFAHTYFTSYPPKVAHAFGMTEAFGNAIALASEGTKGTVCMERGGVNYIHVLFQQQIDPRLFAKTVVYVNPGAEFQSVQSFDRYIFGMKHCPTDTASAIIVRKKSLPAAVQKSRIWTINTVGPFLVAIRQTPEKRR